MDRRFVLQTVAATAVFAALPAFAQQGWGSQGSARRRGPELPTVAVADIPYTNNVVENAGFEKGFDKDPRKGWMEREGEGAEAKIVAHQPNNPSSVEPAEGRKALKLAVKKPARYSPKQLNGDWATFIAVPPVSAGATQIVEVKPGAKYALRYRWRGTGFFQTDTIPGPNRGQMNTSVAIQWLGSNMRPLPKDKMEDSEFSFQQHFALTTGKAMQDGSEEWKTFAYPAFPKPEEVAAGKKKVPAGISVPKEAKYARIVIGLTSKHPKAKPELWIDKFEFSEIPPVPVPVPAAPAAPAAPAK